MSAQYLTLFVTIMYFQNQCQCVAAFVRGRAGGIGRGTPFFMDTESAPLTLDRRTQWETGSLHYWYMLIVTMSCRMSYVGELARAARYTIVVLLL